MLYARLTVPGLRPRSVSFCDSRGVDSLVNARTYRAGKLYEGSRNGKKNGEVLFCRVINTFCVAGEFQSSSRTLRVGRKWNCGVRLENDDNYI